MNGKEELEILPELLLDSLFDGVYYVDRAKRIRYWNRAAERITGYSKEEVTGSCCGDNILVHVDYAGKELCHNCPLATTMQDGKQHELTAMLHHKQGYRIPVQIRSAPVRNGAGTIIGAVEIFTDNSNAIEVLQEFEQLKHDVLVDALTKVGNRRYGETMLASLMAEHDASFGVLFVDIDHFKKVNDSYGHETGDEVLVMVASTIKHVVRKLDAVARWGGEEFITLIPGAGQATLELLAERVRAMVEQSFVIKGDRKIAVTVSIGGTLFAPDDTAASVVARADSNMYQSKRSGRNRVIIA